MNKTKLEHIVRELESWLLREYEDDGIQDHYSQETINRFGPNLRRDEYVRIVRTTIKCYLEEE